jgi:tRNA U55 pseudouridine synthase TruB
LREQQENTAETTTQSTPQKRTHEMPLSAEGSQKMTKKSDTNTAKITVEIPLRPDLDAAEGVLAAPLLPRPQISLRLRRQRRGGEAQGELLFSQKVAPLAQQTVGTDKKWEGEEEKDVSGLKSEGPACVPTMVLSGDTRISFAGRLDPMASGLLCLLVGPAAVARQKEFENIGRKVYEFELLLGIRTDTSDVLGVVRETRIAEEPGVSLPPASTLHESTKKRSAGPRTEQEGAGHPAEKRARLDQNGASSAQSKLEPEPEPELESEPELVQRFRQEVLPQYARGTAYSQPYPPFSAIRVKGKPLWAWAKSNDGTLPEEISRLVPSIEARVSELRFLGFKYLSAATVLAQVEKRVDSAPENSDFRQAECVKAWHRALDLDARGVVGAGKEFLVLQCRATVSAGTYIRSLCERMAGELGSIGLALSIRRISLGPYALVDVDEPAADFAQVWRDWRIFDEKQRSSNDKPWTVKRLVFQALQHKEPLSKTGNTRRRAMLSFPGPSGFQHAPASKFLLILTALSAVFFPLAGLQHAVKLAAPRAALFGGILGGGSLSASNGGGVWSDPLAWLWRPFLAQLPLGSAAEVLFGCALLYILARAAERASGSAKFTAFLLWISLLVSLYTLLAAMVLPQPVVMTVPALGTSLPIESRAPLPPSGDSGERPDTEQLAVSQDASTVHEILALVGLAFPPRGVAATGPYGIIFALLVLFWVDQPISYRFRICGVAASDKLFIYALAGQLLAAGFPGSPLPALIGVLAGLTYRFDTVVGLRYRPLPAALRDWGRRVLLPLLEGPTPPPATTVVSAADQRVPRRRPAPPAAQGQRREVLAGDGPPLGAAAFQEALVGFAQQLQAVQQQQQQQQQQQPHPAKWVFFPLNSSAGILAFICENNWLTPDV